MSRQNRVFGVLNDQSIFHGRELSRRGASVRIVDHRGLVRTVHARFVFRDEWATFLAGLGEKHLSK